MLLSAAICNLQCLQHCSFSVLFFSCARSEGWPHHRRTFSIYLCPLSFWSTLQRGVLSTSWCCLSRPCTVFLACVHLALFLASLPLSFVAPISEVHRELSLSRLTVQLHETVPTSFIVSFLPQTELTSLTGCNLSYFDHTPLDCWGQARWLLVYSVHIINETVSV